MTRTVQVQSNRTPASPVAGEMERLSKEFYQQLYKQLDWVRSMGVSDIGDYKVKTNENGALQISYKGKPIMELKADGNFTTTNNYSSENSKELSNLSSMLGNLQQKLNSSQTLDNTGLSQILDNTGLSNISVSDFIRKAFEIVVDNIIRFMQEKGAVIGKAQAGATYSDRSQVSEPQQVPQEEREYEV